MVIQDNNYTFPRNLVGYGENGKNAEWPGGARIAVSICLNYECVSPLTNFSVFESFEMLISTREGAESTYLNGDSQSETWSWEKAGSQPFANARQPNVESDYDYGARSGIWRLLRIFKNHSFKFTLLAVGQALEMNPAVARACVAAGHEIAGHGYRYLDGRDLAPDDEKERIKLAIAAIRSSAGVNPQGWYVGRISPNSVGVVWEAFEELGLPLHWESDYYGDDVPVWVDLPTSLAKIRLQSQNGTRNELGLLHIPYAYDTNDMKFHMAADGLGGSSFFEYLRDAFDMLYEEGGKMLSIGIHPRIVGKPGRARQLQKFLDYISEKPDVWVCTRAEIAAHWRSKFPYERGP
ncbi:Glycoside hydrolase/deacetylase, beta/alpha-barrel [Niveomyces insectorum RCEF 264]|uniref:Glycoside hydrolase/deacetylase, beta/alpha-barrel n=1 Tax=Niveomyces insectorum RCEF 264 TaxID=1081102 RepID=A0A162IAD7_9HYPO|nr:Glycoside hydrolase/deacetylase, beta/alpha-barrel [Niveomyces insectorum RCEF 264]